MKNHTFWNELSRPITVMAPMSGVTDPAFRWMMAKYSKYGGRDIGDHGKENVAGITPGGPDVIYTEFISADGLFLGDKDELLKDMRYSEIERPVVVQFFSPDPERMKRAASLAVEMGFDGIDINMGCPDRSVCKQGAGSELIRSPGLAVKMIRSVKEGSGGVLPVSIKTRAGYDSDDELEDWIGTLLNEDLCALALHARTRKDMYKVPARWDLIKKAVKIRNTLGVGTLILGNGDIDSLSDLHDKVKGSGADGAMVGRALLGNPRFFSGSPEPSPEERLGVLIEHCELFHDLFRERKSFAMVKKHFRGYVSGWEGSKELRSALMEAEDPVEIKRTIEEYLKRAR